LDHIDTDWIRRFQLASGLPVGGWSVLGDDPTADAAAAVHAVHADALSFYIADAEAPYGYTFESTQSGERYTRSRRFVTAFRAAEPTLPAGVSSYCRADQHDLDWAAWARGSFVFLPQAYVNDFGRSVAPAACVRGAAKWFAPSHVHPTIGSYQGIKGIVQPATWIALLHASPSKGFSVYPAEVGMSPENWQAYGAAIKTLAATPSP
ncbi:MAG TPA: hypothetical protein VGU02_10875, partial [Gaiellaceae bacterium]|nr:hypothetical protein [Gaiellaceae bacterium]